MGQPSLAVTSNSRRLNNTMHFAIFFPGIASHCATQDCVLMVGHLYSYDVNMIPFVINMGVGVKHPNLWQISVIINSALTYLFNEDPENKLWHLMVGWFVFTNFMVSSLLFVLLSVFSDEE